MQGPSKETDRRFNEAIDRISDSHGPTYNELRLDIGESFVGWVEMHSNRVNISRGTMLD